MADVDELQELGEALLQRYEEWTLFSRSAETEMDSVMRFVADRFDLLWRIQRAWGVSRGSGAYAPIPWTPLWSPRGRRPQAATTIPAPLTIATAITAPSASVAHQPAPTPAAPHAAPPQENASAPPVFLTSFVPGDSTPVPAPHVVTARTTEPTAHPAAAGADSDAPQPVWLAEFPAAPQAERTESASAQPPHPVPIVHATGAPAAQALSTPDRASPSAPQSTLPLATGPRPAKGPTARRPQESAPPAEQPAEAPAPVDLVTFAPSSPVPATLPHASHRRNLPPISEVQATSQPATPIAPVQPSGAGSTLPLAAPHAVEYEHPSPAGPSLQPPGTRTQPTPAAQPPAVLPHAPTAAVNRAARPDPASPAESGHASHIDAPDQTHPESVPQLAQPSSQRETPILLDDVVERAVKSLVRHLSVEAERRGVTQWR
jgi:hypothetical protein